MATLLIIMMIALMAIAITIMWGIASFHGQRRLRKSIGVEGENAPLTERVANRGIALARDADPVVAAPDWKSSPSPEAPPKFNVVARVNTLSANELWLLSSESSSLKADSLLAAMEAVQGARREGKKLHVMGSDDHPERIIHG